MVFYICSTIASCQAGFQVAFTATEDLERTHPYGRSHLGDAVTVAPLGTVVTATSGAALMVDTAEAEIPESRQEVGTDLLQPPAFLIDALDERHREAVPDPLALRQHFTFRSSLSLIKKLEPISYNPQHSFLKRLSSVIGRLFPIR
ncbi:hypothetical protein NDU88_001195 [Pleurodeles waltl]|uniref:Uncharacterized protein n=1 Tax=Pleurodeles waltl TaxID=8319 RepID=A0AAV7SYT3_PLEWA|nr:hypothetical protein NDU88_001195 [Pleurodeles waltl]